MNLHELRSDTSSQKLANRFFLCKSKIDLDRKNVENIIPLIDNEAFEIYSEAISDLYDERSTVIKEADIFIKTDRKII